MNKKQMIQLAPYLILAYLGDKLAWLYRLYPGDAPLNKALFAIGHVQYAFTKKW